MKTGPTKLLAIYIAEDARYEGMPLYEWLIRAAKDQGLAGATLIKGMEGYGAHREIHTSRILRMSEKLPVKIEIVDNEEKIDGFITLIEPAIMEGLATVSDVEARIFNIDRKDS